MRTVDVIIPSWNGRDLLANCLPSLAMQTRPPDGVIVVDNGSSDGTVEWIATQWPDVRVIDLPANEGYAGAVQAGIDSSSADLVALLNNDATPHAGWLDALSEAFSWESVGACASVIITPEGPIESAGIGFSIWGVGYRLMEGLDPCQIPAGLSEVFGASGGAFMAKRDAIMRSGGFDRSFFAQDEDIDLAFRLRYAGYTCLLHSGAVVRHLGGRTLSRDRQRSLALAQRNLELVFWLNTPWWLWPVLGAFHGGYQAVSALRHCAAGRGHTVIAAKLAACRMLPLLLRQRGQPKGFQRLIVPWLSRGLRCWHPPAKDEQ